jgi:hypothetical protein
MAPAGVITMMSSLLVVESEGKRETLVQNAPAAHYGPQGYFEPATPPFI